MNAYYEWLRMKRFEPFLPWGKICFEVMHINLLRVYPHLEREGLQLADAVAAAFFKACDKYDTGACDPQYAKLLRDRMAREPDNHNGRISGFGVKLLPSFAKAKLDSDQTEIFRHYGYPGQWWDPEAFHAKRPIRRCGAGSTTPHPESLSLIRDFRLSVEPSRPDAPPGARDLVVPRSVAAVACSLQGLRPQGRRCQASSRVWEPAHGMLAGIVFKFHVRSRE